MTTDPRADVARFFDLEREPLDDLAFYVARVPGREARVLELGCGTGRITFPLARHCAFMHGIDLSEAMIAICRSKLSPARLSRGRLLVHVGDITRFALATSFDLIIAPFRVLQNLTTDAEVSGVLACVRQHLAPGGTCILNVFRPQDPDAAAMISAWSEPAEGLDWEKHTPIGDITCHHRKGKVQANPLVIFPDLVYRVREKSGVVEEVVHHLAMRCWFPDEFVALIEKHGFEIVNRWGGYSGEVYGEGPELVLEFRLPDP